jgi:hypothetical protein
MLKYAFSLFLAIYSLLLSSCGKHELEGLLNCEDVTCIIDEATKILRQTGWLAEEENYDIPEEIPDGPTNMPAEVDLESKFPPVGDQGNYGTCVAWATGYNLKTSLNAIEKGWSSSDLAKPENQTSPKDLWFAIDPAKKSANCGGTNFEPALDALVSKGVSNLGLSPYANMGNCTGTTNGDPSNKLANYRKIAYDYSLSGGSGSGRGGMTVNNFKSYLAQGRPVLVGAKLGDRFMVWNSSSVITSDTYNEPGMQHAYHAMILTGYDDSKGGGAGAFRIRNSWADDWGDNGSIWVGYDFFINEFCFSAFVAENPASTAPIAMRIGAEGYDLQVSNAKDALNPKTENDPRARVFEYKIHNAGTQAIPASQKWTVYYMYYNAFNANEFGIIFENSNINVLPGEEKGFEISYAMPNITGKYYMVIYADAFDAIQEINESNNFYFIGAKDGKPLEFANGIMQNDSVSVARTVQEMGGSLNAYTPAEIKKLVAKKIAR